MMESHLTLEARGLGKDYYSHKVFDLLDDLMSFYDVLSDSSFSMDNSTIITGKISINYNIYSSILGTVESIKVLTFAGRLNDVFALLRKLDDAILTSLYINTLVKVDLDRVVETDDSIKDIWDDSIARLWVQQDTPLWKNNKIEEIRNQVEQIEPELKKLLNSNSFRQECNNNVHYNSWSYFAINDYDFIKGRGLGVGLLDRIYQTLTTLFTYHFAFTYMYSPYLYSASNYVDALDMGLIPEIDSQYWVAPIVQDVFDKYIKTNNEKVAKYLIDKNLMKLH